MAFTTTGTQTVLCPDRTILFTTIAATPEPADNTASPSAPSSVESDETEASTAPSSPVTDPLSDDINANYATLDSSPWFRDERRKIFTTSIPFPIRHRFLNWLIRKFEASCQLFVRTKLPFCIYTKQFGWVSTQMLILPSGKTDMNRMDLSEWKYAFDKLEKGYGLDSSYFTIADRKRRRQIREGADQVRHAAVHRWDLDMEHLWAAMHLPRMFGDSDAETECARTFDLVRKVCQADAGATQENIDALDEIFEAEEGRFLTQTDLYAFAQARIELALFQYTQMHHPDSMERKRWTFPEEGELPRWQELYEFGPPAIQDAFRDSEKDLLSQSLRLGRDLRNAAVHRADEEMSLTVKRMMDVIKLLTILGDDEGALEVEIEAERFFTGCSREDVLARLGACLLEEGIEQGEDGFAARRQARRRIAISTAMAAENITPFTSTDELREPDYPQQLAATVSTAYELSIAKAQQERYGEEDPRPKECIPHGIPDMIVLSTPCDFDNRREMHCDSMHPILKALPVPKGYLKWCIEHLWREDKKAEEEEKELRALFGIEGAEVKTVQATIVEAVPMEEDWSSETSTLVSDSVEEDEEMEYSTDQTSVVDGEETVGSDELECYESSTETHKRMWADVEGARDGHQSNNLDEPQLWEDNIVEADGSTTTNQSLTSDNTNDQTGNSAKSNSGKRSRTGATPFSPRKTRSMTALHGKNAQATDLFLTPSYALPTISWSLKVKDTPTVRTGSPVDSPGLRSKRRKLMTTDV